jgi:hypothetical protein
MFGTHKYAPVAEHEAAGETERVYHDIRQVLRVSGVNLNFRTWAAFEKSFPLVWTALRDNAGTYAFENAADALRAEVVRGALELPRVGATASAPLGDSQLYQVGAALALYHYINPKLLILTSAVRIALDEAEGIPGSPSADVRKLPRGVPARMYPMEMVDEDSDEPQIEPVFEDIRKTLSVDHINSDYRTLALWPQYFAIAWQRLKPIMASPEYIALAASLQRRADELARALPYRVKLSRLDIASVGEDDDEFTTVTRRFEALLPPLIVNIALLTLDGTPPELCVESPFPVPEMEGEPS